MTPTQLYWLTRMDSINVVLITVSIVLSIILTITTIGFFEAWIAYEKKPFSMKFLLGWLALIVVVVLTCLVPTTKEMAAILIVPKIVNNAKVQELPEAVLTLANEWLQELIPGSLKPESKGEK